MTTEEELIQLHTDQAVLMLAIERGYLSSDQAALLQLDIPLVPDETEVQ